MADTTIHNESQLYETPKQQSEVIIFEGVLIGQVEIKSSISDFFDQFAETFEANPSPISS